jgi:hypothetical protein
MQKVGVDPPVAVTGIGLNVLGRCAVLLVCSSRGPVNPVPLQDPLRAARCSSSSPSCSRSQVSCWRPLGSSAGARARGALFESWSGIKVLAAHRWKLAMLFAARPA